LDLLLGENLLVLVLLLGLHEFLLVWSSLILGGELLFLFSSIVLHKRLISFKKESVIVSLRSILTKMLSLIQRYV
jgi:hypothetical protein